MTLSNIISKPLLISHISQTISLRIPYAVYMAAWIAAAAPSAAAVVTWRMVFTQISPAAYTPGIIHNIVGKLMAKPSSI